jgi:methyl-accepting chemotaxis protein
LAFVTIGVVILVIIFGFFFSKTISKPLEKLIMGIERIGKGDLEHRVDVRGKDEIGKLALAFNHMTERRQEAEKALRKAHDELEQRVEERTSELVREIEERKRVEKEREKLIHEIQDALAQIKKLSGLLPICASCKKIRDDEGYWNQVEVYIRDHSEAEFTHSICPDCMKKLYPDV